jgi:hypothetical protein
LSIFIEGGIKKMSQNEGTIPGWIRQFWWLLLIFLVLVLVCGWGFANNWAFGLQPTPEPTQESTQAATEVSTEVPTSEPTQEATQEPTKEVTQEPTQEATEPVTFTCVVVQGDGVCNKNCENAENDPKDCATTCTIKVGDGLCDPRCENTDLDPKDCTCVNDGVCDLAAGEGYSCIDCSPAAACGASCDPAVGCFNPNSNTTPLSCYNHDNSADGSTECWAGVCDAKPNPVTCPDTLANCNCNFPITNPNYPVCVYPALTCSDGSQITAPSGGTCDSYCTYYYYTSCG